MVILIYLTQCQGPKKYPAGKILAKDVSEQEQTPL
jgi:hypothetical protein